MGAHKMLQELYRAGHQIPDPGASGVIQVDRDHAIIALGTSAAETRTVPDPTVPGLTLTLVTLGVTTSVTLTFATAINTTGNNTAAATADRKVMRLVSIPVSSTANAWQVISNDFTLSTV